MATPTYTLIDSVTLGSSSASVTFSSIPAGGDLVLVIDSKSTTSSNTYLRFNGDSGSNYSYGTMYGSGSTTGSFFYSDSRIYLHGGLGLTGAFQAIVNIQDYSATDKHKTVIGRVSSPGQYVTADAGRWASTAAITSILVGNLGSYTYPAGTTFFLYGIAKAL